MQASIVKPKALRPGDTIGVFTPSAPSYTSNDELFTNGLEALKKQGFKIKLGSLTEKRNSQGYRSGTPEERAKEFMALIQDPEVRCLISTIGGNNSASMIPHLDFARIRQERKIICGFSDVTSLHLAILKYSGLVTVYGPSVMCWFGDWEGISESTDWWLEAVMKHQQGSRVVVSPARWSNHLRRWDNGDWKNIPREWKTNEGWTVLNPGRVEAPVLAVNLNTLMTAAGTSYWPDLRGKVLLIEDMYAPLSRTERLLQHLKLVGGLDQIGGLIVGKPENYDQEGAPFGYDELIKEVVGPRKYPIVSNFDCSHTVPMISIPQMTPVRLTAEGQTAQFEFLDGSVE
ncbi:S66 peptidase family protein [Bdellovibrio sp. HCB2-146]|uniref:S66 peptidase family protein n=1 Tax=Bdellovibrio sp. HCB2-146 TaxID=3394362 RepID=UPI0039BCAFC6